MANTGLATSTGVRAAYEGYCALVQRIGERQGLWNSTAKEFIFQMLERLAGEFKPLRAVKVESVRNFDTICFGYMPAPTNIVLKQGAGAKGLVKLGGCLFYSQLFNGKILIGMSYPYVEGLQDPEPNKGFAILDPEEITESKILEHVEHFFKELIEDERSLSMDEELQKRGSIGFGALRDRYAETTSPSVILAARNEK